MTSLALLVLVVDPEESDLCCSCPSATQMGSHSMKILRAVLLVEVMRVCLSFVVVMEMLGFQDDEKESRAVRREERICMRLLV